MYSYGIPIALQGRSVQQSKPLWMPNLPPPSPNGESILGQLTRISMRQRRVKLHPVPRVRFHGEPVSIRHAGLQGISGRDAESIVAPVLNVVVHPVADEGAQTLVLPCKPRCCVAGRKREGENVFGRDVVVVSRTCVSVSRGEARREKRGCMEEGEGEMTAGKDGEEEGGREGGREEEGKEDSPGATKCRQRSVSTLLTLKRVTLCALKLSMSRLTFSSRHCWFTPAWHSQSCTKPPGTSSSRQKFVPSGSLECSVVTPVRASLCSGLRGSSVWFRCWAKGSGEAATKEREASRVVSNMLTIGKRFEFQSIVK